MPRTFAVPENKQPEYRRHGYVLLCQRHSEGKSVRAQKQISLRRQQGWATGSVRDTRGRSGPTAQRAAPGAGEREGKGRTFLLCSEISSQALSCLQGSFLLLMFSLQTTVKKGTVFAGDMTAVTGTLLHQVFYFLFLFLCKETILGTQSS